MQILKKKAAVYSHIPSVIIVWIFRVEVGCVFANEDVAGYAGYEMDEDGTGRAGATFGTPCGLSRSRMMFGLGVGPGRSDPGPTPRSACHKP